MMTDEIGIANEIKAVERWENEGGKVSPFRSVWTSLKSFRTEDSSREGTAVDTKKSPRQQAGVFSTVDVRRAV